MGVQEAIHQIDTLPFKLAELAVHILDQRDRQETRIDAAAKDARQELNIAPRDSQ